MSAVTMKDVMEFLVDHRAPSLPLGALADLFDRMIWLTENNGDEIFKVRNSWLSGEDPLRVEIALLMNEVFPFDNRSLMETRFSEIAAKWPRLEGICRQVLNQWDRQYKDS